jgi:hypothetical protein
MIANRPHFRTWWSRGLLAVSIVASLVTIPAVTRLGQLQPLGRLSGQRNHSTTPSQEFPGTFTSPRRPRGSAGTVGISGILQTPGFSTGVTLNNLPTQWMARAFCASTSEPSSRRRRFGPDY